MDVQIIQPVFEAIDNGLNVRQLIQHSMGGIIWPSQIKG